MKNLTSALVAWLPFAVAILCIYGAMFLAVQQYIRLSANELPLQYAEDTKERIEKGLPAAMALKTTDTVDMDNSLAPFTIVYSRTGTVLASDAILNRKVPIPPQGVFDQALKDGENRRTWQPAEGVRVAAVVLPWSGRGQKGFVLAGRSLREAEMREQFLHDQLSIAAILTLTATYITILLTNFTRKQ